MQEAECLCQGHVKSVSPEQDQDRLQITRLLAQCCFLPSCPVRAFLVLSSFDFHSTLFQPHLTSSLFLTPTSLNQVTDQCCPQQGLPSPFSLTHDLCHFFMVYRLLGAVSFPFMGYHYQIVNLLFPTR